MTTLREAAQQALEALEFVTLDFFMLNPISPGRESTIKAITALRAALAEPVQEPVAWALHTGTKQGIKWNRRVEHGTPLYTAPPQRKPLTDEEIYAAIKGVDSLRAVEVARAIERAHGIGGQDEP